jgi:hypothetical protein
MPKEGRRTHAYRSQIPWFKIPGVDLPASHPLFTCSLDFQAIVDDVGQRERALRACAEIESHFRVGIVQADRSSDLIDKCTVTET